jgi:circadian clock protein KaiC
MTSSNSHERPPALLEKARTGIAGLDEITGGGLPRGRTSLLVGGPGTGKTVLALQTLVNGAALHGEPGLFVTFEESPQNLRANAATFGWDLSALEDKLFFLDARLSPSVVRTGEFELTGLLASLSAKVAALKARRIVFDAIDVLLLLLDNVAAERQEIYRLQEWLAREGLTGIVTAKSDVAGQLADARYGYMQYLADCAIALRHDLTERVALRYLRVLKYRGSSFADNEFPLVFGVSGMEVGGLGRAETEYVALEERVPTGVPRLDTMLAGGYYRGSSILVSGSPGTAKSTLAGALVQSCCARGERALYFCFDEAASEIQRNLTSVNIQLQPCVEGGLLQLITMLSETRSAEEHLLVIKQALARHQAKVIVIDPISSMIKAGGPGAATVVLRRLVRLAKSQGITLFLTSLLANTDAASEATPIEISTIADTWIHLSYVPIGGERNRALTVIKSRGTHHSNQVRELQLGDDGVTLSDVYTARGEVLMGTARWEKEEADRLLAEREAVESELRLQRNASAQAETRARLEALQREFLAQQAEAELLAHDQAARMKRSADRERRLYERRGGDQPPPEETQP